MWRILFFSPCNPQSIYFIMYRNLKAHLWESMWLKCQGDQHSNPFTNHHKQYESSWNACSHLLCHDVRFTNHKLTEFETKLRLWAGSCLSLIRWVENHTIGSFIKPTITTLFLDVTWSLITTVLPSAVVVLKNNQQKDSRYLLWQMGHRIMFQHPSSEYLEGFYYVTALYWII